MDTFIKGVRIWVKKQEIKELITQGKYELFKVHKQEGGRKSYVYKFILSDGEELAYGFNAPLNPKKE